MSEKETKPFQESFSPFTSAHRETELDNEYTSAIMVDQNFVYLE